MEIKIKKKQIKISIPESDYWELKAYAESKHRSISRFALVAMLSEVKKHKSYARRRLEEFMKKEKIATDIEIPENADGFIYFVQEKLSKKIKVGYSKKIEQRLIDLNLSNPNGLEVLCIISGNFEIESAIHHRLRKFNACGEWFYSHDEVYRFIASLKAKKSRYDKYIQKQASNAISSRALRSQANINKVTDRK